MIRACTKRYFELLDQSRSGAILAESVREAYSDLFAINTRAQELSQDGVKNKFRTLTEGQNSENVLELMAKTFKALTELADWEPSLAEKQPQPEKTENPPEEHREERKHSERERRMGSEGGSRPTRRELHYNIQVVLPETRGVAVFDAIFESLKKHLL